MNKLPSLDSFPLWELGFSFEKIDPTEEKLSKWSQDPKAKDEDRATAHILISTFLQNPENTRLCLSDLSLSTLPEIFDDSRFKKLRTLDVSKNNLSTLPESLCACNELEVLQASANYLTFIPDFFGNLPCLTTLMLDCNFLNSLPPSIGLLTRLKYLSALLNELETLPDFFADLRNLEHLQVAGNGLRYLPLSLMGCYKLQTFRASANKLTALPDFFHLFTDLRVLQLNNNRLSSFPPSFEKCQRLALLDILHNPIKNLSTGISSLPNSCSVHFTHKRENLEKVTNLFAKKKKDSPSFYYYLDEFAYPSGLSPRLKKAYYLQKFGHFKNNQIRKNNHV